MMVDEDSGGDRALERRRLWRPIILILLAGAALALTMAWVGRRPIAEHFVERGFAARGIRASYDVTQVALRTQRIENLVLGDPARPDLTARSVEVDIGYGMLFPKVGAVRARGVRVYGRVSEQGLRLGELDKLRDPASTSPLGLPDIDLTLDDARMRLDTPAGPVGIVLRGNGNLRNGFRGKGAALIRDATISGCMLPLASAYLDVRVNGGSPRISGPVRAASVRCDGDGFASAQIALRTDIAFSPELDRWQGSITGGAAAARANGITIARPGADMRIEGSPDRIGGTGRLRVAALGSGNMRAGPGEISGEWSLRGNAVAARGQFVAADVRAFDSRALQEAARGAGATPLGPLLGKLADSLTALQSDNDLSGRFVLEPTSIRFSALELQGARGAHIGLSSGGGLSRSLPDGLWSLDGAVTSGGGGLPEMALRLSRRPDGGMAGQMFVQPYKAGDARFDVEPVRFAAAPGGITNITTSLRLDGPLSDGSVRGLEVPIVAAWGPHGLSVNPACVPVRFSSLSAGPMRLGRSALRLCPVGGAMFTLRGGKMGGGVSAASPRLTGRIGDAPLHLSARTARYMTNEGSFVLDGVGMRLGAAEAPVLLSAARLTGGAVRGGAGGRASGIAAQIGTVPLLVRDADARWTLVNGALALAGALTVLDDANPDRFNPMRSSDFRFTLGGGRIEGTGSLHLPGRDRIIADVRLWHSLDTGAGHADFAVDGLRFDKQLQPDEITPVALGVVANVDGVVTGKGRIAWTGNQVTSSGEFSTQDTDLAAAFGPVQGLSTRIRFTDLLGLVTEPGQMMTLKSVHPGIEVRDGVIRYALLPGQRVSIESGRWPFAGGDLALLPTVMDMSAEQPRRLAFRVVGLDAGAFIQTLELENIFATGTYDGLLPMVFDANGGRIEGGLLTARQSGMPPLVIDSTRGLDIPCDPDRQGGRLSYVGQVSNENLGRFGKLAFDALKDLQYKCLTILMDGALDGEVVTQVTFNGVNRGRLSSVPSPIASQFVGLPFIFNITIAAPFRGLINTARSFVDPSLLIRQHLGEGVVPALQNKLAVQPAESDTVQTGGRK